jgi:hypothetical protein
MHAGSLEALRVTRPEAVDLGRIKEQVVEGKTPEISIDQAQTLIQLIN